MGLVSILYLTIVRCFSWPSMLSDCHLSLSSDLEQLNPWIRHQSLVERSEGTLVKQAN